MSHDIRTPMNVIMGFTNIALQHADDPGKMKECLEKIRVSGSNLQELIDDVLDISHIESGEFKIVSQPVKLRSCLTSTARPSRVWRRRKTSAFRGSCTTFPTMCCSPTRSASGRSMNLLSNAVKYTPENGDVKLEVYEEKLAESGKVRLVSVVSDTGIGMTPEFMEQLRGYKVHCVRAVNGQDCLQRIEQAAPDEFDAILMDMQMPVMNGLEATAAIRKLDSETAKHIPIIALTANAYHEDIQKCLAAGMNAHLSKPINIDRAVRTIIECARTAKENG